MDTKKETQEPKTQAEIIKKILNAIQTENAARVVIGVLLHRHGAGLCKEVVEYASALRAEILKEEDIADGQ